MQAPIPPLGQSGFVLKQHIVANAGARGVSQWLEALLDARKEGKERTREEERRRKIAKLV